MASVWLRPTNGSDYLAMLHAAKERHADFWEEKLRAAERGCRVVQARAIAARVPWDAVVLSTLNDHDRLDGPGLSQATRVARTRCRPEASPHARLLRLLSGGAGVE
jgi:hypothetical protein